MRKVIASGNGTARGVGTQRAGGKADTDHLVARFQVRRPLWNKGFELHDVRGAHKNRNVEIGVESDDAQRTRLSITERG